MLNFLTKNAQTWTPLEQNINMGKILEMLSHFNGWLPNSCNGTWTWLKLALDMWNKLNFNGWIPSNSQQTKIAVGAHFHSHRGLELSIK